MRIIQILTTMSFGDAIGNDAIALKGAISDMGFQTDHVDLTADNSLNVLREPDRRSA